MPKVEVQQDRLLQSLLGLLLGVVTGSQGAFGVGGRIGANIELGGPNPPRGRFYLDPAIGLRTSNLGQLGVGGTTLGKVALSDRPEYDYLFRLLTHPPGGRGPRDPWWPQDPLLSFTFGGREQYNEPDFKWSRRE